MAWVLLSHLTHWLDLLTCRDGGGPGRKEEREGHKASHHSDTISFFDFPRLFTSSIMRSDLLVGRDALRAIAVVSHPS